MTTILRDLRFGLRHLARQPVATVAAVASLALGVGANTAIFSLMDSLLFKPLDVWAPHELIIFGDETNTGISKSNLPQSRRFSYLRYTDLRDSNRSLSDLAAIGVDRTAYLKAAGETSPSSVQTRMVSGNYFSMLGVPAAAGRLLSPDDDESEAPLLVLSHRYWRQRFGSDLAVVGQEVVLNDRSFTVLGIAEPGFEGERLGSPPDIWVPLAMQPVVTRSARWLEDRQFSFLQLMGRLAPGVSIEAAETEMAQLWREINLGEVSGEPSEAWLRALDRSPIFLTPGARGFNSLSNFEDPLWMLLAVSALVLLVACSNVTNLLLARATARDREMAVRSALGAGRGRLFGQMLTESLLLAGLAGAASLIVAVWVRATLLSLAAGSPEMWGLEAGLDWRMLGFTGAAAALTGVLFGTAPALRVSRARIAQAIKSGGRGALGRSRMGLQSALVSGQVALSLALLFAAGLFLSSLDRLMRTDLGFNRESLLAVEVDPQGAGFTLEELPGLYRRLTDEAAAVPGVAAAAMSMSPLIANSTTQYSVTIEDYESAEDEDPSARMYYVSPEYFETVGTPILRGRSFDARDGEGAAVKLIVDDSFARRFFGEDDPVGRRVRFSQALGMVEIVGVVGPTFQWGVRQAPEPTLYVSGYAAPQYLRGLMVRTTGDPASRAVELRQAVERAEPRLPVGSIETVETRLENSLRSERLLSLLTSGFGLLALLLAAVGLYGVMSYRAARRTSEIGLRMAIGARAGDIVQMMLREASLFVGIGIAVGLLGAAAIGRLAAPLLYETQAFDWSSLACAGAVLLAAALGASLIPSLRASRVSPIEALRDDG